MKAKPLKILLIDDMPSVEEEVQNGLAKIGVSTEINYHCPKSRDKPFGGCRLPEGQDLDEVDLALIDLELFPPLEPVSYSREDLRGGTEVLPYLRREAPWVPVIAYSRLFKPDSEHFLAIACSFGFDGHTTRGMFGSPGFTRKLWDGLLEQAHLQRRRAVVGEHCQATSDSVILDLPPTDATRLDGKFPSWRNVAQATFFLSRKVVLEPLRGGWSGAEVLRAYVCQRPEDGGREGEWLWKVSSSPWKLHREVQAHLRMVRSGLNFARIVPLLWHGVIVEDGVAAIAYQFAKGTREASEILQEKNGLEVLCERLVPMLDEFYRDKGKERDLIGKLLSDWCPRGESLLMAAKQIPETEFAEFLKLLAKKKDGRKLSKSIQYQQCMVHGDLHLGNIMLGDHNVFIDFALSRVGPIAIDVAKLVSDILLHVPTIRNDRVPDWNNETDPVCQAIKPIKAILNFTPGDAELFGLLLKIYLAQSLNYDDVLREDKEWIKKVLSTGANKG